MSVEFLSKGSFLIILNLGSWIEKYFHKLKRRKAGPQIKGPVWKGKEDGK